MLVHPERSAERGGAPVHAPHPVAGLPLAQVRELDPLAASPRDLVPDENLRLERRHQRAERLLGRVDAQPLRLAGPPLPRADAEQVAGAEQHRPDRVRTPALAMQLQLDRLLLARAQVERPCGRALRLQLGRQQEEQLESVDAAGRQQLDRRCDVVTFECALAVKRQLDGDLGFAPGHGRDESEHERGCERDRLDSAEGQAGDEPRRGQSCVGGQSG